MNRYGLKAGHAHRIPQPPRPPLRSLQELADEFGQPLQVLASIMSKDPAAPKPELDHSTHFARARYFNAAAVRAWWKARKA